MGWLRPVSTPASGTEGMGLEQRVVEAEARCAELEGQVRHLAAELRKERSANNTLRGQLDIAIDANKQNLRAYRSDALNRFASDVTETMPIPVLTIPGERL